jgi:hypothetical protein
MADPHASSWYTVALVKGELRIVQSSVSRNAELLECRRSRAIAELVSAPEFDARLSTRRLNSRS